MFVALQVAERLPDGQQEIRESLTKNAMDLEHYHKDLVMPMTQLSEQLSQSAEILQEHIKFNHTSMADAIHDLVQEVIKAQKFLNEDGPQYVHFVSIHFLASLMFVVKNFSER